MAITTHNDASSEKERANMSKQSKVISTRNVVPYNRPIRKEDVTAFVDKRNTALENNVVEEIKPAIANVDDDGSVIIKDNADDYASYREKVEEEVKTEPIADEQPIPVKPKRGRKPKVAE